MIGISRHRELLSQAAAFFLSGRILPASLLYGAFFTIMAVGLAPVPSAGALELVQPFFSRNMNPFVQIFGLPTAEGAVPTPEHRLETRLVLDIANNYAGSIYQGEGSVIIGETYRSVLAMRYGLLKKLEIGIDLPFIAQSRGNFNDFIREWHKTFGLSGGGRDKATDDQLLYSYTDDGKEPFAITDPTSGLGDVLLSAALPLWEGSGQQHRRLALRAALKLPTGDASDLLGSGSTDLSLRLCGEDPQTFANARISWFGSLGALFLTKGDVISDRQRQTVGFGTVGFGWQPLSWLALKLQLDGHTAFYSSALTELGDPSAQLIMGGTLGLPADFKLDLAVSEDIVVNTAPDVVFHFDLLRTF